MESEEALTLAGLSTPLAIFNTVYPVRGGAGVGGIGVGGIGVGGIGVELLRSSGPLRPSTFLH